MIFIEKLKKIPFNKLMVVGISIFLVVFVHETYDLIRETQIEPGVTVAAVFAAATGEYGFLAMLKKDERRRKDEQTDSDKETDQP